METSLASSSSPSRSRSEKQNQRTLVVHLNRDIVKVTLFPETQPAIAISDVFGEFIPFFVGIMHEKTFVFGQRCLMYREQKRSQPSWKNSLCYWDVGKSLLQGPGTATQMKIDGRFVNITTELLIGFFLKYILSLSENGCDDNETSTTKIMFAVPNWFSSWCRQTLKNGAEVAGFNEHFVVNETTLLSYIHLGKLRSLPETKTMVTIAENCGHISIVYYSGSWDEFLNASAFTSTVTASGPFTLETYNKMQYAKYTQYCRTVKSNSEYRLQVFKDLWEEFLQKLPVNAISKSTDILSTCDDQEWQKVIQEEINCIVYKHFGMPPQAKKKSQPTYVDSPLKPLRLMSNMVCDILPLPVFRGSTAHGVRRLKIMEGDQEIAFKKSFTTDIHCYDPYSKFFQCSLTGEHHFGDLKFPKLLLYKYLCIKVKIVVSKEGIYDVESVTGVKKGMEEPLSSPAEYSYRSTVSKTDLPKVAEEVEAFYLKSVQRINALSKLKDELWRICSKIQDMQAEGTYEIVPERKMRHEIRDEMETIQKYLAQPVDVLFLDDDYLESSLTKAENYWARYFFL